MGSLTTKILPNQGTPSPADYVHFLRCLLDGVSLRAIEGESRALRQFRTDMSALSGKLSEHSNCAEISSALDSSLRCLADYNKRTEKFVAVPVRTSRTTAGLLERSEAEQAIGEKITADTDCVCGMFLVNRLASIKARFGQNVGDEVMLFVAERLVQYLPAGAMIFRWKDSALLALVDVEENISDVNRRFARAASVNLEKNIEMGQRFVMVPINLAFTLKRLSAKCAPSETVEELDRFVSAHTGETGNMLQ